ncbi:peptidoglycan editing factor PgeF [Shewanella sp.]|uniref:peptidoglycan editing factor PgeF n=1 Tax=Shewanella sp. TaxID=50422 RepID=UPI003562F12C
MPIGEWLIPQGVHLAFTSRNGGVSQAPYSSLNLGLHVGDDAGCVLENRTIVHQRLGLCAEPVWLEQVHGIHVHTISKSDTSASGKASMVAGGSEVPKADACYTKVPGAVCVVMSADCLPVLFASRDGLEVAAAHAGWRGLCEGVLEATLAQFESAATDIYAYLGPAIGPTAFEVGAEVRAAFIVQDAQAECCFEDIGGGKYLADIFALARQRLGRAGIKHCFGDDICTYSNPSEYFSYRRDRVTGRMAALIWRD